MAPPTGRHGHISPALVSGQNAQIHSMSCLQEPVSSTTMTHTGNDIRMRPTMRIGSKVIADTGKALHIDTLPLGRRVASDSGN